MFEFSVLVLINLFLIGLILYTTWSIISLNISSKQRARIYKILSDKQDVYIKSLNHKEFEKLSKVFDDYFRNFDNHHKAVFRFKNPYNLYSKELLNEIGYENGKKTK